jgi:hypothetical protein
VVYEAANVSTISADRYGFSEFVDKDEFRFVDFSGANLVRYKMEEVLNLENAIKFCEGISVGSVKPLKSVVIDQVDRLERDRALEYVKSGWVAVGFCEGNLRCLRNLSIVKRELRMRGAGDVRVGNFDGRINEWPARAPINSLPGVVLFRDGEVIARMSGVGTSPNAITAEMVHQYNRASRDQL